MSTEDKKIDPFVSAVAVPYRPLENLSTQNELLEIFERQIPIPEKKGLVLPHIRELDLEPHKKDVDVELPSPQALVQESLKKGVDEELLSSHDLVQQLDTDVRVDQSQIKEATKVTRVVVPKSSRTQQRSQYKINQIVSSLAQCEIYTKQDLIKNFRKVLSKILENPEIFSSDRSIKSHFKLFQSALQAYSNATAIKLTLSDSV